MDGQNAIKEAGTGLDLDDLEPFLFRMSSLFENGLGGEKIRSVVRSVERLKVDAERESIFSVHYSSGPEILRMAVFMDDIDAPDVSFFGGPAVIERIEAEIRRFTDEQNAKLPAGTGSTQRRRLSEIASGN